MTHIMKTSSAILILALIGFAYAAVDPTLNCTIPMTDCVKAWCHMNHTETDLSKYQKGNLTLFSSHTLQDLGDYKQCSKYSATSRYVLGQFEQLNSHSIFYLAFCGPVNCTADEYTELYPWIQGYFGTNFPELNNTNATFMDPTKFQAESDFAYVFIIVLLSAIVSMAVCGSYVGGLTREKKKKSFAIPSGDALSAENSARDNPSLYQSLMPFMDELDSRKPTPLRVIECFDLTKNYQTLIQDEKKPGHDEGLHVFNGIRFLAFAWVVYGHTTGTMSGYMKNISAAGPFIKSWDFLVLYAGIYAVDIFFFLSGFLAAYMIIAKVNRMPPSPSSYLKIVFHRIFRLWPSYFVCIFIFWRILPYLGSGPMWFQAIRGSNQCDTTWWQNLLFIDNLLDTEASDPACFGWGWYISVDMQIFLVVPIICWAYNYNKTYGRLLIFALLTLSVIGGFGYAIANNFPYEIPPQNFSFDAWRFFYVNPIVRASPYLVGALFGILYQKFKSGEEKNFFHILTEQKCLSYLLSLIGLTLTLLIVYLPRDPQTSGHQWVEWWGYTWQALSRPVYTLGLFLFIAPCMLGYIGTLKSVLTCGFFSMMSKLTYTGYLVHYMVLIAMIYSIPQYIEFSHEQVVYKTLAFLVITLTFAPFIYLFVEKPFANLEANVLNPRPRKIISQVEDPEKRSIVEARGSVQDTA